MLPAWAKHVVHLPPRRTGPVHVAADLENFGWRSLPRRNVLRENKRRWNAKLLGFSLCDICGGLKEALGSPLSAISSPLLGFSGGYPHCPGCDPCDGPPQPGCSDICASEIHTAEVTLIGGWASQLCNNCDLTMTLALPFLNSFPGLCTWQLLFVTWCGGNPPFDNFSLTVTCNIILVPLSIKVVAEISDAGSFRFSEAFYELEATPAMVCSETPVVLNKTRDFHNPSFGFMCSGAMGNTCQISFRRN